jgi:hypothetical protein
MGRHEARPSILEDIVHDYARQRARELIAQADDPGTVLGHLAAAAWIGQATEILRELTRDA